MMSVCGAGPCRSFVRASRAGKTATAAASVAGAFLIAPAAGVALAIFRFLVLAARYDKHSGSCFMIALLIVIVLATAAMSVGFLALMAR